MLSTRCCFWCYLWFLYIIQHWCVTVIKIYIYLSYWCTSDIFMKPVKPHSTFTSSHTPYILDKFDLISKPSFLNLRWALQHLLSCHLRTYLNWSIIPLVCNIRNYELKEHKTFWLLRIFNQVSKSYLFASFTLQILLFLSWIIHVPCSRNFVAVSYNNYLKWCNSILQTFPKWFSVCTSLWTHSFFRLPPKDKNRIWFDWNQFSKLLNLPRQGFHEYYFIDLFWMRPPFLLPASRGVNAMQQWNTTV